MFLDGIKSIDASKRIMDTDEVKRNDPLVLAYLGDTLYDLYVRSRLVFTGDYKAGNLHKMSIKYVCAYGQAKALDIVEDNLDEEEKNIVRRAKNAKASPPKNTDKSTYMKATAFEALAGYLYLIGSNERLEEMFKRVFDGISENQ